MKNNLLCLALLAALAFTIPALAADPAPSGIDFEPKPAHASPAADAVLPEPQAATLDDFMRSTQAAPAPGEAAAAPGSMENEFRPVQPRFELRDF